MQSKRLILFAVAVVTAAVLAVGSWLVWFQKDRNPPIPDEKEAGVALLATTLTGPGYFHGPDRPAETLLGEGGPWIAPQDALDQLERVSRTRGYAAARTEKVKELIEKLTEPHPSRVVGGERIQLVRLNLALDQLKE